MRKIKRSIFHIVVNPNIHIQHIDNNFSETFYNSAVDLFTKKERLFSYLEGHSIRKYKDGEIDFSKDIMNDVIDDVQITIGKEIGEKQSRFHLDIYLHITHRSCLRFNSKKLRLYFARVVSYLTNENRNVHLDVRAYADSQFHTKQYSEKNGDFVTFTL
jgi:hypothetical protein